MAADRRLLLVHAHPDDETINNGATMAKYAAAGVDVTLVTCTLGEYGEILVPELAELASDRGDQLGGYRVLELTRAMDALGVSDHRFLLGAGHLRDSGMIGTAANDGPRAFWRASRDPAVFAAAVKALVDIIGAVRPQVVVTYDENGGYGHPDHVMAHRVTMAAIDAAAAPDVDAGRQPWDVAKVYWNVLSRSQLQHGLDAIRPAGTDFIVVDSVDELPYLAEDSSVTTVVEAGAFVAAKTAAMRAHATQIVVDEPFFALSNDIGVMICGTEQYRLVRGSLIGPFDADGHEVDLFAGVR